MKIRSIRKVSSSESCRSTRNIVKIIPVLLLPILCFAKPVSKGDSNTSKAEPPSAPLNLELPPSSPVFILLGIEPASIERPGTPTDFAFSILKATDNLSVLPRDYAIEVAPFWLCKNKPSTTYEEYWSGKGNECWTTFRNTATVSLATVSRPDTSLDSFVTSLGLGLRFSIIQSEIIYKDTLDALSSTLTNTIWIREEEFLDTLEMIEDSMSNVSDSLRFIKDSLRALSDTSGSIKDTLESIQDSLKILIDSLESNRKSWDDDSLHNLRIKEHKLLAKIDDIVEKKRLVRKGGEIDFAGAGVFDFPQGEFENGTFNKLGIWFTGAWEWYNAGLVGTLRGFYGDLGTAKLSGDAGARAIWDISDEFSLSFEATARGFVNPSNGENYHLRWDLIAEYAVTKNNLLSFTFGKDYTKGIFEGDLIASISFKQGFGSKRPTFEVPTK